MTDNDLATYLNDARALASDLHRDKCMVGPEGFTSHHPDCQTLRSLVSATDALRAERDKLKQERDSFKAVYEAAKQQVRDEIRRAGETADRICKERDAYLADCEALRAQVAEFKRLQQVWLMSPEAAKRLDAYRELAQKCAQMEARIAALEGSKAIEDDFDALRAERDSLRAQVEAARERCRDILFREDTLEDAYVDAALAIIDAMDEAAK